jgi:hypothetical protein
MAQQFANRAFNQWGQVNRVWVPSSSASWI